MMFDKIGKWALPGLAGMTMAVGVAAPAVAVPFDVLWWDTTPEYGSQAPDALRQTMSDYLTNFGGGGVFNSTYVSSPGPGAFSTHMASNAYDVIVFDSTGGGGFSAADLSAVQTHYSTNSNVLLDGNLYVRSINFNATSVFPGPNGATGGLTANQVNQLATRGGGILIGTDHNCCQSEANAILGSIITGAAFTGSTSPSTDGIFYGSDLLNDVAAIAASDVLAHWSSIVSQGIAPTGNFTDTNGNAVTLHSQVDVANFIGGPKNSFISTSWAPGSGTTDVDDDTTGGTGGGCGTPGQQACAVPEPGTLGLFGLGLAGLFIVVRRRRETD